MLTIRVGNFGGGVAFHHWYSIVVSTRGGTRLVQERILPYLFSPPIVVVHGRGFHPPIHHSHGQIQGPFPAIVVQIIRRIKFVGRKAPVGVKPIGRSAKIILAGKGVRFRVNARHIGPGPPPPSTGNLPISLLSRMSVTGITHAPFHGGKAQDGIRVTGTGVGFIFTQSSTLQHVQVSGPRCDTLFPILPRRSVLGRQVVGIHRFRPRRGHATPQSSSTTGGCHTRPNGNVSERFHRHLAVVKYVSKQLQDTVTGLIGNATLYVIEQDKVGGPQIGLTALPIRGRIRRYIVFDAGTLAKGTPQHIGWGRQ